MCHSHFKRNVLLNYAPEELNEIVSRLDADNADDEKETAMVDERGGHQQKQQQNKPLQLYSKSQQQPHQQLQLQEKLFSGGRIYGLRVIFKPASLRRDESVPVHIRGEYAFLDRANFENDGRLIPGTYCDYYFFADEEQKTVTNETNDVWKYFHSPRYPANYAAHIQCTYKFIGRPETRVEVVFTELIMPKNQENCNLDKVTIYDAESPNVSSIIDVICETVHNKRIFSNGPDLLIEFNASSNQTAKGFRGKFKFVDAIKLKRNKTASWVIANPKLNEVLFQESHRTILTNTNNMATTNTGSGSSSLLLVNPLALG
ncbi:uncharacterized protein LOC129916630 isoform X2 [Episyrphus balteatus]|uniref:uncharacterized protein LOC129916630 isoform X2 n=1 Tax=Episyrphus balteatus TaxID=286459 RepID=UPI002485673C|nr:uncharacterized protein LOC129916630 isoform X2 [Episyrphus balteatus]